MAAALQGSLECEKLIRSQEDLSTRIGSTWARFCEQENERLSADVAQVRLTMLEDRWRRYQENHTQLIRQHWSEVVTLPYYTANAFAATEDSYVLQRAEFLRLIKRQEQLNQPPSCISPPRFSGKFRDWPEFRQVFRASILQDARYTEEQKTRALEEAIQGKALAIMQEARAERLNLQGMWSRIRTHFENKKLRMRAALADYAAIPVTRPGSAEDLRRLLQETKGLEAFLQSFERETEHNDVLVWFAVTKLSPAQQQEWSRSINSLAEPPTMSEWYRHVETALKHLQRPMTQSTTPPPSYSASIRSSRNPALQTSSSLTERKPLKCSLCLGPHYILNCGAFAKMGPRARKQLAETSRLCLNCFGTHALKQCPSTKKCSSCRGRHYSSIHEACMGPTRIAESSPRPDSRTPESTSWYEECEEEKRRARSSSASSGEVPQAEAPPSAGICDPRLLTTDRRIAAEPQPTSTPGAAAALEDSSPAETATSAEAASSAPVVTREISTVAVQPVTYNQIFSQELVEAVAERIAELRAIAITSMDEK